MPAPAQPIVIHWEARQVLLPSGERAFKGTISVPLLPPLTGAANAHLVKATSVAPTKASAIKQAATIADQLTSNPVIASLMPPGAGLAIQAVKMLSTHVDSGDVQGALKKFAGPAAQRLTKALANIF